MIAEPYMRPAPRCPECGGPADTGAGHDCQPGERYHRHGPSTDPVDVERRALRRHMCRHCGLEPVDREDGWELCPACGDSAVWAEPCDNCDKVPTGRERRPCYREG